MTHELTPDTFHLTPEEQAGIDIARGTHNAADARTKAAIDSIVARFPRAPVEDVNISLPGDPNPTYAGTGGHDAIHVGFVWPYEYKAVTFSGQLRVNRQYIGDPFLWTPNGHYEQPVLGLAWALPDGSIGQTFTTEELTGLIDLCIYVQYDISQFTYYRNVGIGLLNSPYVGSNDITLIS